MICRVVIFSFFCFCKPCGVIRMDNICSGSEMNFRIVFFFHLFILVNPAGGSRMDSICSESEMNCRVVVKATLNSVSKIISVYVSLKY